LRTAAGGWVLICTLLDMLILLVSWLRVELLFLRMYIPVIGAHLYEC
jgi:hypothetical protein